VIVQLDCVVKAQLSNVGTVYPSSHQKRYHFTITNNPDEQST